MKLSFLHGIRWVAVLSATLALFLAACPGETADRRRLRGKQTSAEHRVEVVERSGKLANFPCGRCHQHVDNSVPAAKRKHTEIRPLHFEGAEQCGVCHSSQAMEQLELVNGTRVSLNEAHLLCAQCHSSRYKDWTLGAHGKSVGSWKGTVHRLGCPECHDPHRPAIDAVVARPAPPFPTLGIRKGAHP